MSVEERNKAIVRRMVDQLWNKWDVSVIREVYAPEWIEHISGTTRRATIAMQEQVFHEWRAAFPDWWIKIDVILAEGDLVSARLDSGGTQTGPYLGQAPSGRRVEATGIEVWRFADGKLVEFWANVDELGMLRQLGIIPPDSNPTA